MTKYIVRAESNDYEWCYIRLSCKIIDETSESIFYQRQKMSILEFHEGSNSIWLPRVNDKKYKQWKIRSKYLQSWIKSVLYLDPLFTLWGRDGLHAFMSMLHCNLSERNSRLAPGAYHHLDNQTILDGFKNYNISIG